MAWIVKLPLTSASTKPPGKCATRDGTTQRSAGIYPTRAEAAASNARSNTEITSHTPTNSHPLAA